MTGGAVRRDVMVLSRAALPGGGSFKARHPAQFERPSTVKHPSTLVYERPSTVFYHVGRPSTVFYVVPTINRTERSRD